MADGNRLRATEILDIGSSVTENTIGELRRINDPARRIMIAEHLAEALRQVVENATEEVQESYGYPPPIR